MPLDVRGDDDMQASFGAWTVLAMLSPASLPIDAKEAWLMSAGIAVLIAAPAGMGVLRGAYDRARGRYTRGGLPFLVALIVAFPGCLTAGQPVG